MPWAARLSLCACSSTGLLLQIQVQSAAERALPSCPPPSSRLRAATPPRPLERPNHLRHQVLMHLLVDPSTLQGRGSSAPARLPARIFFSLCCPSLLNSAFGLTPLHPAQLLAPPAARPSRPTLVVRWDCSLTSWSQSLLYCAPPAVCLSLQLRTRLPRPHCAKLPGQPWWPHRGPSW